MSALLNPLHGSASGGASVAGASGARATDHVRQPLHAASFTDLLRRAQGIDTQRPVSIARDVPTNLGAEQLARVARAVDQAEASGAVRALVLIDGQALTVDVQTRQIVGAVEATSPCVLTNIDTMVIAPPAESAESAASGPLSPSMADMNPSLVRAMATSSASRG